MPNVPKALLAVTLFIGFSHILGQVAPAGPVTFINDYQGFVAAAGDVRVIDFDTLPDGRPTTGTTVETITPEFNYTGQGVTFSAAVGDLFIGGNSVSGFELFADAYLEQQHTWIIADLGPAASAVGVTFAGGMILNAYNNEGDLIVTTQFGDAGGVWFLGIVSDEPIARATANNQDTHSLIGDFVYSPVPEPLTAIFLLLGSIAVVRKRLDRNLTLLVVATLSVFIAAQEADAGPVTFINDYQGFLAAAGDVRVIDFETLPNGSPAMGGSLLRRNLIIRI